MIIGYARISTGEQNIGTQIEILKENRCDKIFTDKASGVKTDRQGLNQMIESLHNGDTNPYKIYLLYNKYIICNFAKIIILRNRNNLRTKITLSFIIEDTHLL